MQQNTAAEAFFVETDTMAIGVMKAFKEASRSIPGDVSIVSCNDIPEAQYIEPSLTTMRIHTELMGIMAARIVMDKIRYPRQGGLKVIVPNELVVRESCRTSLPAAVSPIDNYIGASNII